MTTRFPLNTDPTIMKKASSSSTQQQQQPFIQSSSSSNSFTTNATNQEENFSIHGWKFQTLKTPILNQTEMEQLKEELDVYALPEQTFNSYLSLKKEDVCFEFRYSPKDCMKFARNQVIDDQQQYGEQLLPKIKVNCSESWANKKLEGEETIVSERDDKIDWTFTTVYKGTKILSNNSTDNTNNNSSNSSSSSVSGKEEEELVMTTKKIDYEVLKRKDDPILFYDEIVLFEDDLHDHGVSHSTVKIRVMNHCFYVLMRFFLRVDGVCVRCIETRLFHKFGQDFLLREFSIRESAWKELMNNHSFNAQFSFDQSVISNPNILSPLLKVKQEQTDEIKL